MSKMDLIKYVLEELASNGRVARGQVMSTEYDIQYTSQKATKRRVLYGYLAQQPTDDCQPRKSEVPDEDISRYSNRKIESDRSRRRGLTPNPNGF
jgi:hypothetical protein